VSAERDQTQQQSLYRRHRPRTFTHVVGQESVVRTLTNAVQLGKVHHAYLFVGSRGTGKTSMAKILAACLNCELGPTVEPCGTCDSCTAIAQASSLDVIEMDAASNNSVDDIRELRESVAYAPVSGRTKVYILDEAHMLSSAAWNAFLKTLEEPPPNTVFVLATTEAQKVPATVIDRCHRFDFQRPTVEQLAIVVRRAAEAESVEIPSSAVAAVARSATGSFRDALGTLEQLVTYSGREIALDDVLAVLGIADSALLEETLDAVGQGDARAALLAIGRCAQSGRDAGTFASDLEARTRELLVVQILGDVPAELSLTPEADVRLSDQARRLDGATLVRLLELLGRAREAVRAGGDPRTQLELALVKAAKPEVDLTTKALLSRIERLEAAGPAPRSAGSPKQDAEHPPTPEQHPPPRAAPAESEGDIETLRSLWPAVIDMVRSQNALLGALIAEAQPVGVQGKELTVAFPSSAPFLKKKAEDPTNRSAVAEALHAVTGRRMALVYELHAELPMGHAKADTASARTEEEWVAHFMAEFDAEELPGEPLGERVDEPSSEWALEQRRAQEGE
jgi:DNA polymerase III subunit gamma/tau